MPLCPHWDRAVSPPEHATSSIQMGPVPSPKRALWGADSTLPQPSCLHTTWASNRSQASSHTVPHWPLWKISTRPEQELFPPLARRTSPSTPVLLYSGVVVDTVEVTLMMWVGEGFGGVGRTVLFDPEGHSTHTVLKTTLDQGNGNDKLPFDLEVFLL